MSSNYKCDILEILNKGDFLTIYFLYFIGMDSLDIMNDLDTISFLDNNTWNTPVTTGGTNSLSSNLHPASYSSFANSYLEDMTGSTAIMVNPNNVMPIHPLQHQQVTSLSVNTSLHSPTHSQNSPQSPMPSPMFNQQQMQVQAGQQQVYSATQRPAKSVRVLPPVSSPMQQVRNFFEYSKSAGEDKDHIMFFVFARKLFKPQGYPTKNVNNSRFWQIIFHSQVPSSASSTSNTSSNRKKNQKSQNSHANNEGKENGYPKPAYSYSCLIALALKNSQTGSMSVSEIYKFMW